MKIYSDAQILKSIILNEGTTDSSSLFLAVCLEILGYTPLDQLLVADESRKEYEEFEDRYDTVYSRYSATK